MNIEDFFKKFNKLVKPVNLHDITISERVKFVKENYDHFNICGGCAKLIYHTEAICPYCKSYRFTKPSKEFIENLKDDSEYVDYFIFES